MHNKKHGRLSKGSNFQLGPCIQWGPTGIGAWISALICISCGGITEWLTCTVRSYLGNLKVFRSCKNGQMHGKLNIMVIKVKCYKSVRFRYRMYCKMIMMMRLCDALMGQRIEYCVQFWSAILQKRHCFALKRALCSSQG